MTSDKNNGTEPRAQGDPGSARSRPAPLPKRFYKAVSVASIGGVPATGKAATAFRILLEGKPIRTPAKAELAVPTQALAEAIAAEWQAQGERIDAATMPLTRLANSAIDGVAPRLGPGPRRHRRLRRP